MIGSGRRFPSKAQCVALFRTVLIRLWEICFLSLIALLITGMTMDSWRPFAFAGLVSLLSDKVVMPWQSLRGSVAAFLLHCVAEKGAQEDPPQVQIANRDTASGRGV